MGSTYFLTHQRKIPSKKVLAKLLVLAKNQKITVLIQDHRRGDDHLFSDFLRSDPEQIEQRIKEVQLWIAATKDKIAEYCADEDITVPEIEFEPIEGNNWVNLLVSFIRHRTDLLIVDATMNVRKLLPEMSKISCDILLLGHQYWASNIKTLCAIDPLHREDQECEIDMAVTARGNWLSEQYGARVSLIYCCYVAPYLMRYKAQILANQKKGLEEFIGKKHLQSLPIHMPDGNPEEALPKAISQMKANILIMGACQRSATSRFWSGSTTDALLESLPCDLLLVNKNRHD
ncbi:universal stress protein [Vibrio sp. Isolate25]|uniref:universal stress protein n=1 Tax=unclassified Vibrio TaxID=2614977 RepID=UPI001EFD242B|nr:MULTISPECIES: universal stress protein [unclassified Vibrio]MCG9598254.1 universal stress protein [Vibrio sp. Isolate25]MCG9679425.1 universal stress protein [Vibrio sp. Isolate24]